MDVRHLRREARTALELAVVSLAPQSILDHLATATGLLEALGELPSDSPPALTLTPRVLARTRRSLAEWSKWREENLALKMPRS